jgi:uncharacterized membrane protein YfhO
MEQRAKIKDAFHKILANLSARKQAELAAEIALVQQLVEPATNPVSTFWQDKERSAKARENMKLAGQARRAKLRLIWRTSGREEVVDYKEVAKLVGRAEMTVRIAISRGEGLAHFAYNDDAITVQRL